VKLITHLFLVAGFIKAHSVRPIVCEAFLTLCAFFPHNAVRECCMVMEMESALKNTFGNCVLCILDVTKFRHMETSVTGPIAFTEKSRAD
jgi:hypothetical protein